MVIYAHFATILLTCLVLAKVPSTYMTVCLGIEGICLLVTGFTLRDSLFRSWGLVALAILTGRLLIFDMPKFNTLERIISFISGGIVLLLSSYGYAKFTHAFEEEKR